MLEKNTPENLEDKIPEADLEIQDLSKSESIEDIISNAEGSEKRKESTDRIEEAVEKRFIKSREGKRSSTLKRLFATITASLVLGGAIEAQGQQVRPVKLKTGSSIQQNEKQNQKTESSAQQDEKQSQLLYKETGINLGRMAKEAGFIASSRVENGNGDYLIHVGQIHFTNVQDLETNEERRNQIIESQKQIEHFIKDIIKHGGEREVVKEGECDTTSQKFYTMLHQELNNILKLPNWDRAMSSYYSQIQHQVIHERMHTQVAYLFIKSVDDFAKKDPTSATTQKTEQLKAIFNRDYKLGSIQGPDVIYLCGAVDKLAIDKVIKIIPAETREANFAAGQELYKYMALESVMKNAQFLAEHAPTVEEKKVNMQIYKVLAEQCIEEKKIFQKVVLDDRNDIGIERAASNLTHGKIKIIVYGAAHDFKPNVEKFNAAHPDHRLGEIDFKPAKYDLSLAVHQ